MYQPQFNREKFRELMLYIADQSRDDPWFGAVKLNKILFYCDFQAFAWLHESITGATYVKLTEGPAPRQLMRERRTIVDEGFATIETKRVFRFTQQRLTPTKLGIMLGENFTDTEKEVVDDVLGFLEPLTAKEVSDLSHDEPGWILAREREVIPYETVWLTHSSDVEVAMMAEGGAASMAVVAN